MIPVRHARSHALAADGDGLGAATAASTVTVVSRIAAAHNKPAIARAPDKILLFMSSPSGTDRSAAESILEGTSSRNFALQVDRRGILGLERRNQPISLLRGIASTPPPLCS